MAININVTNIKKSRTNILTLESSAVKLADNHSQEWVNSGVDKEIISLNVQSIAGKEVIEFLNIQDLNHWQLQRRYNEVIQGGWLCGTVFKADTPRTIKKKIVKYENPTGVEIKPVLLQLPERIWQAIATKWGVHKPIDMDGWEWVQLNPQIPIAVTEGVKKAGCIITNQLIPTIALPGHRASYIYEGDVRFVEYVHVEREIYLCFDNDVKQSTRLEVNKTVQGVVQRLTRDANHKLLTIPRAQLKVCQWQGSKGIDDIFILLGNDAVTNIFSSAVSWHNWVDDSYNTLGFEPSITFNSSKFQFVELHPETILIGIKGAKGSGKTWYLEQLVAQAKANKRPIISIVHRIQLAISISNRLGLTYIEDIDGKVADNNSISLVIDSLAKINPEKFKGGLIIIDEIVQVLEHLITSDTCKRKRQRILKTLRNLCKVIVESGGQFVVADADLNEASLRFLIGFLGDDIVPYIIENTYREPSYKCFVSDGHKQLINNRIIKTPIDVIATAINAALQGKRVMLCVTGQDEQSKYGTINLEKLFLRFGIFSVLRIDSETTKNPEHPAYKATSKINQLCDSYQVIIGSPSMGTGVSIENRIAFDLCCGIFTGVGSPDSVRQFLMRLRDKTVPRLIWVAERGNDNSYINLGTTAQTIETRSNELFDFTQTLLTNHDNEWVAEYPEIKHCNTSSYYFNNLIAAKNKEVNKFKNYVVHGLKLENVKLTEVDTANDIFTFDIACNELYDIATETKDTSLETYRSQLEKQELINDDDYSKLKNQVDLTDTERVALEARVLSKRYGDAIPVTEELAAKDADGWYNQLRLHYACTVGYEVTQDLQVLSASSQVVSGEGSVIRHDFIERQKLIAKAEFIRESGLLDLLDKPALSDNDTDCIETFEYLVEQQENVHLIFGKSLQIKKADKFSMRPIQVMFENLGIISSKQKQVTLNGKRVRPYTLNYSDNRNVVFDAWLTNDTERAKVWGERKHEWEVNRLVRNCTKDVDLQYLEALKARDIFNEVWEHVDTNTRIQLINRIDGFALPNPIKQQIDPNADNYHAILADITTWQEISLDIETYGNDKKNKEGLHANKGHIRLIQVSNGETIYYANLGGRDDNKATIHESLNDFLTLLNKQLSNPNVKIIGQNIHFDLRFLRFQLGFNRARNISDTMLGAKVLFGDYGKLRVLPGGYGLGNLALKFLGLEIDKTEQKSDWGATLTTEQINYAVTDPYITYWVYKRLLEVYENPSKFGFEKLSQNGLMDAWQLENDIVPCAIELEYVGLPFDKEKAEANLKQCQNIQAKLLDEWSNLVPGLNYSQNQKLVIHLNEKYNTNIKSLNKTALADLNKYPEIKLLSKLRAIKIPIQQLESLIRSAEKTGRVQTVFNTLTGTGRFSSGNSKVFNDLPNLQSISAKEHPALKEYALPGVRTCVAVSGNRGFGIIDLAASHGRIAADVADDEVAILGCNDESIDNHSKVAEYVAKALGHNITWEDIQANKKVQPYKGYRDAAKNTYYGWLNGAGAKRVQEQIKANSGQIVSIEACQAAIKGCEQLYPNVVNFRKQLVSELSNKVNLLYVDGKYYAVNNIKAVNNHITHLVKVDGNDIDLPYTQCLAAIWSRTEATALKRALIQIVDLAENKPEWELKAINYVHDEINIEFNLNYAEIVLTTVNNIIGDCFAAILSKVNDGRETNWKKLQVNNWSEK